MKIILGNFVVFVYENQKTNGTKFCKLIFS